MGVFMNKELAHNSVWLQKHNMTIHVKMTPQPFKKIISMSDIYVVFVAL
jgi:hypothetical protein